MDSNGGGPGSRSWHTLLGVLLTASCVLNGLLAREVNRLALAVSAAKAERTWQAGETLPSGMKGKRLSGGEADLTFTTGSKGTLVYVLRAGCVWCTRNAANFKVLADHVKNRYDIRVLALDDDLDALDAYVTDNYPGLDVTYRLPTSLKQRMGGTPQTLLADSRGVIQRVWVGSYGGTVQQEIEVQFGVALPGLSPAPESTPRGSH